MANFLFYLASNLGLFVAVLLACNLHGRLASRPPVNGAYLFIALASSAFAFDAALTFLVFADAQNRYGQYSTQDAFLQRASAYSLAIVVAFALHRTVQRKRAARKLAARSPILDTPAYPESQRSM